MNGSTGGETRDVSTGMEAALPGLGVFGQAVASMLALLRPVVEFPPVRDNSAEVEVAASPGSLKL